MEWWSNHGLERMCKESAVAYFMTLPNNSHGDTEKSQETFQSDLALNRTLSRILSNSFAFYIFTISVKHIIEIYNYAQISFTINHFSEIDKFLHDFMYIFLNSLNGGWNPTGSTRHGGH
jgi:hypothetical protein